MKRHIHQEHRKLQDTHAGDASNALAALIKSAVENSLGRETAVYKRFVEQAAELLRLKVPRHLEQMARDAVKESETLSGEYSHLSRSRRHMTRLKKKKSLPAKKSCFAGCRRRARCQPTKTESDEDEEEQSAASIEWKEEDTPFVKLVVWRMGQRHLSEATLCLQGRTEEPCDKHALSVKPERAAASKGAPAGSVKFKWNSVKNLMNLDAGHVDDDRIKAQEQKNALEEQKNARDEQASDSLGRIRDCVRDVSMKAKKAGNETFFLYALRTTIENIHTTGGLPGPYSLMSGAMLHVVSGLLYVLDTLFGRATYANEARAALQKRLTAEYLAFGISLFLMLFPLLAVIFTLAVGADLSNMNLAEQYSVQRRRRLYVGLGFFTVLVVPLLLFVVRRFHKAESHGATSQKWHVNPSSLVRLFQASQYLLEPASAAWIAYHSANLD